MEVYSFLTTEEIKLNYHILLRINLGLFLSKFFPFDAIRHVIVTMYVCS